MLRDGFCGVGRYIADRDAACFGSRKVDIVVPGGGYADELQLRGGIDDRLCEFHFGGKDSLCVFNCRNDILRCDAIVSDQIAKLCKLVPVQVVQVDRVGI